MNGVDNIKRSISAIFGRAGDMRTTGIVFIVVMLAGLFIADKYTVSKEAFAIILLWILSSLAVGASVGFLFGIPKIVQNNLVNASAEQLKINEANEYKQQVNSNLTEISDWLTKIIVGLTLINLGKFPPYLHSIATTFATGLNSTSPKSSLAFAYGIIVCYSVIGFLFGYITTRLFLAAAFSRADQEALSKLQKTIESTKAQVEAIESNQSFINQSLYKPDGQQLEGSDTSDKERGSNGQQASVVLKELEQKAISYLKINHADWGERVRLKDLAGNDMANYALLNNIRKQDIVELAQNTANEALVLALAVMISIRPEKGDLEKIMAVAPMVLRLHIRHKVTVALGQLFKSGLVESKDREAVLKLLNSTYKRNADEPLIKTIDSTITLINSVEERKTN